MAPTIFTATRQLDYPVYCADFIDNHHLVVAGGGGESKTGIGNKISLLQTTSKTDVPLIDELELSRSEDSVTSLAAVSGFNTDTAGVYAGINSSTQALRAGRNNHFRTFTVKKSGSSKPDGILASRIKPVAQHSLLQSDQPRFETYQRITRVLQNPSSPKRVVAIASGSASRGEVVIVSQDVEEGRFEPEVSVELGEGGEAVDLDICKSVDGELLVGFCTADRVFTLRHKLQTGPRQLSLPSRESPSEAGVRLMYTIPPTNGGPGTKIRALRFLTPSLIALLINKPSKSGAEIQLLRLFDEDGDIILRKKLSRKTKVATGMDVAVLRDPGNREAQAVIAVAGQNISIELLSLDIPSTSAPTRFYMLQYLRNVHQLQITSLKFAHWTPPPHPIEATVEAQYLKLASVSIANSVVVHTIPLIPIPPTSRTARYVASHRKSDQMGRYSLLVYILTILLAFGMQLGLEYFGVCPDYTGITTRLSPLLHQRDAEPMTQAPAASTAAAIIPEAPRLSKLSEAQDGIEYLVAVRDSDQEVILDVVPEKDVKGKRWHELEEGEKQRWREKLVAAGHWATDEGETILKNVVFGQIAGFVGQAVAGG